MKQITILLLQCILFILNTNYSFSQSQEFKELYTKLESKSWEGTGKTTLLWYGSDWQRWCNIRLVFEDNSKLKYSERGSGIQGQTIYFNYKILSFEKNKNFPSTYYDKWGEKQTAPFHKDIMTLYIESTSSKLDYNGLNSYIGEGIKLYVWVKPNALIIKTKLEEHDYKYDERYLWIVE